jgi:hypothetical protein
MASFRKFRWLPASGARPVTLGDDAAGDKISSDPPSQSRAVSNVQLAEADYTTQFESGNRTNEIRWTVDRDHGSEDKAKVFSRLHHDAVETAGILEDGGDGFTPLYLLNAVIQTRCVSIDGRTTVFEYIVRGGIWSTRSIAT